MFRMEDGNRGVVKMLVWGESGWTKEGHETGQGANGWGWGVVFGNLVGNVEVSWRVKKDCQRGSPEQVSPQSERLWLKTQVSEWGDSRYSVVAAAGQVQSMTVEVGGWRAMEG